MEKLPQSKNTTTVQQTTSSSSVSSKVEYTSYDNLPPYAEEENFLEVMRTVSTLIVQIEEKDWKDQFNLLNELRRMLKYQKELFFNIFNNYKIHQKILPKFINSLRSNLAKVALTLVSEIFNTYETESVNEWIDSLLPEVLLKSAIDLKAFIKEEAVKCLKNFSENMFYPESIISLLKGIKNANTKISENAFETLIKLIQNYEIVSMKNLENWKDIFTGMIEIYKMKRDPYIKRPLKIIKALQNKLGEDFVDQLFKDNLREKDLQIILQIKKTTSSSGSEGTVRSSSNTSLRQRIRDLNKGKSKVEKNEGLVLKENEELKLDANKEVVEIGENKENIQPSNENIEMNTNNNMPVEVEVIRESESNRNNN